MDHINSFPAYESHYTRKHNEHREYLCESLNIRKMYCLYKEKCEAGGKTVLKETYYRYIFNTKFNLHFYLPKKDTCKKCDIYKIKVTHSDLTPEEKATVQTDHELHLRKAELARDSMKADAEIAKKTLTFMFVV